ncbi:substrate-binding periplasmic protein, partial [Pseudomonas aeruginosa]
MSFRCSPCRLAGILLAALFVPGLAAAAGSCERLVATGNPEYPPYLWRDPQDPKRLIGANADLLQRLGKELGVRIDVLYSGSWEKAQEEVTSGRADLLAGAYLTLARLGSMDYVHPPFLMTSGVVWVNKDAAFPFIGRDDLIGHKGSVLAGSSLGEEFDRFAKASLDLKPVPSLTQGLQDLMLKRSEFLLYQALPGQAQV